MKPKVAFIGTGGTIASLGVGPLDLQDYGATGNVMHADEIVAKWPETALVADVLPVRYRNIPSTAIDFPDWQALVTLCGKLVAEHADLAGIVIGHGTATLEETAYFLNLTLKVPVPVVLVGAQRPSSALSTDAGLNLVNAIRVAASPEARGMGVLVVVNDEIQAARDVTKTSTLRLQTFRTARFRRARPCRWRCGRVLSPPAAPLLSGHRVRHPRAGCVAARRHRLRLRGRRTAPRCAPSSPPVRRASSRRASPRAFPRPAIRRAERGRRARRRRGAVHPRRQRPDLPRQRLANAGFLIADNLIPQKARILLLLALTVTSDPDRIAHVPARRWRSLSGQSGPGHRRGTVRS